MNQNHLFGEFLNNNIKLINPNTNHKKCWDEKIENARVIVENDENYKICAVTLSNRDNYF